MGSSTQTPVLQLPLFGDLDKPTWRGDVNGAFQSIDDGVADVHTDIDDINTELDGVQSSLLTKMVKDTVVVNAADHGGVQQALDFAPAGSTVFIGAGNYAVPAGGFIVKKTGLTIDAMSAVFQVSNWGTPAFLALRANNGADNNRYRIGLVQYTGTRGNHTGPPIYGSSPYCAGCAVLTNGDRNTIEYVRTIGMPTPVNFSSWDGSTSADRVGVGNRIVYMEAEGYDFGLLYVKQTGFDWGNGYCHDDIDDSSGTNPTHAIYCSASNGNRSSVGQMGRWKTVNHTKGHPFIFKYQDDFSFDTLQTLNSMGVVMIQDCNDVSGNKATANNSISTANSGHFAMGFTTAMSKRVRIGQINIVAAAGVNDRLVALYCDDMTVSQINTVTNRTTSDPNIGDVVVRGNRVNVGKLRTLATGNTTIAGAMGLGVAGDCTDCTIDDVDATGSGNDAKPLAIYATSLNCRWSRRNEETYGAAAPTAGTWKQGARVRNYAPVVGQPKGWICTVAGTPGTWVSEGVL